MGSRARRLAALQARIVRCRLCPRLVAHREAVGDPPPPRHAGERYWARPVPSLGAVDARLLVVGLAPAAHGGNRTGRLFTGDAAGGSGAWVARALHAHRFATRATSERRGDGFRLLDAYITAALHCAPPDNRPRPDELARCAAYLATEVGLLAQVRVVVALGRIGFDAYLRTRRAQGHPSLVPRPVFAHGRRVALPDGVVLLASYHPSRQNTQTGRLTWPRFSAIFAEARRCLDAAGSVTVRGRRAPRARAPRGRRRTGTATEAARSGPGRHSRPPA